MKKYFALLIILYIFLDSSATCCYADDCNNDTKTEDIGQNEQDKKKDTCDDCSQFFNCGSCSGFIALVTTFLKTDLSLKTLIPFYHFSFPNEFVAKIWHPPI